MNTYLIRMRRPDGTYQTTYVEATSPETAAAIARDREPGMAIGAMYLMTKLEIPA